MRMTSGSSSSARRKASMPSPASPTTSIPGSAWSTISRPRRKSTWSSATRTRIGSAASSTSAWEVCPAPTSAVLPPTCGACGPRPQIPHAHAGHHCTPAESRHRARIARDAAFGSGQAGAAPPGPLAGRPLRRARPAILGTGASDRVDLEVDDAVGPPATAVDDAGLPRVRVVEEVEVVADELHLVERVLQRHGSAGVDLLAHLDRGLPDRAEGAFRPVRVGGLVRSGERTSLGTASGLRDQPAGGLRHRLRHSPARPGDAAPVGGAAEPFEELVQRDVQRGVDVIGTGFGTDHRALGVAGDLDGVAVAHGLLMGHDDVDARDPGKKVGHLRELLLEVRPEAVGDLGVSAGDDDVHVVVHVVLLAVGEGFASGLAGPRYRRPTSHPPQRRSPATTVTLPAVRRNRVVRPVRRRLDVRRRASRPPTPRRVAAWRPASRRPRPAHPSRGRPGRPRPGSRRWSPRRPRARPSGRGARPPRRRARRRRRPGWPPARGGPGSTGRRAGGSGRRTGSDRSASPSTCAAAAATRSPTGSSPRRRTAARDDGIGTTTTGRPPAATVSDSASSSARTGRRSRRPSSL